MATDLQVADLAEKLKRYKSRYLHKDFSKLDESATRLMINSFLMDVLGYAELEDIKTEYRIRGEYADYVIQVGRKKWFVVEVKSIGIDLNEKHLRQSLNYAANEGIDWILLVNGRQIELYRVNFSKPIRSTLVINLNLLDKHDFKVAPQVIVCLTKRAIQKNELDAFWKRTTALSTSTLAKNIYSDDVARLIRSSLKRETGIYFQLDDISKKLYEVITEPIDFGRPKLKKLK